MAILHYLTDEPVFMANPSSIDIDKNEIILAHCTLPLNMPDPFLNFPEMVKNISYPGEK